MNWIPPRITIIKKTSKTYNSLCDSISSAKSPEEKKMLEGVKAQFDSTDRKR